MGIEQAQLDLEAEIAAFNQGDLKRQPADGSTDWWRLRALILGLSYIKQAQRLAVHNDPAASNRLYLASNKQFKGLEVPPAPVIVKETLPDGSLPTGVSN